MFSIQFTVYMTAYSVQDSLQCTWQLTVYRIVFSVQYSFQCTGQLTVYRIVYSVQDSLQCTGLCTVYSVQWTLSSDFSRLFRQWVTCPLTQWLSSQLSTMKVCCQHGKYLEIDLLLQFRQIFFRLFTINVSPCIELLVARWLSNLFAPILVEKNLIS